MPAFVADSDAATKDPRAETAPVLLNEKFVVHSYNGGSQQSRSQYDVKHVLIPTLDPFHCSDRGCKFNLILKCAEDFTLTHFYISGPGPRCTEPIRSGLVWVCSELPEDLEITSAYDDLSCEELQALPQEKADAMGLPIRFQTDSESREAELELPQWQEGRFLVIRFLDTHYAEEQVNVDVGMIALVGHLGRCSRYQVPFGPWMRRRVQQAWVHTRPLQRSFSAGGWVCDGRDFTGGCRGNFTDFHQTNMYHSRFHCPVTGFDLCDACAQDTSLGKVTEESIKADIETLQNPTSCKLVGNRLRNLWRRNWLQALPRYFRHGLLWSLMTGLQRCLDITHTGKARAALEEEAVGRRSRVPRPVLQADPQQAAALRALLQLVSDLAQGILLGMRPGDLQVNDLAWALQGTPNGLPRWERCRVISLPPNFPSVGTEEMDGGAFLVSCRDWKGKRYVQAENLWKVTKQLNDDEVVAATTGLFREVCRGPLCDPNEARRLICHLADLSAVNADGQTALLGAAKHGCSPQVITLLLEARACPDQSDRHGVTALQLLNTEAHTRCLLRHGATELEVSLAGPDSTLSLLQEALSAELLGPLLALRGVGCSLEGYRPPPPEALEVLLLLLRALPMPVLRRTFFEEEAGAMESLGRLMQKTIEGYSGIAVAHYCLRIARTLKARAREEPRLLEFLYRSGVHRWAAQVMSMGDFQQGGCFGPAIPQEKMVPNEEVLREASSLCEELSGERADPCMQPALAGAVAALERAFDKGGVAKALLAVRDLFEGRRCTPYELEFAHLPGRLLQLLQGGEHWALFQQAFQDPKAALLGLVQALQSVVSSAEGFQIWRYRRDRGLKALTEAVQLRLEGQKEQAQEREVVSVMVEPLVSLNEIQRYLLRVSPVSEEYLAFCHGIVGCTLRDKVFGEGKVISFELLFADCPMPVHTIHFASGESQRLLLALRDYEYLADATATPLDVELRTALSLLHLAAGSAGYPQLLDELRKSLRGPESMKDDGDMEVDASLPGLCTSGSESEGDRSSSGSAPRGPKAGFARGCVVQALSRAVRTGESCPGALELVEAERNRLLQASAISAGCETSVGVDPASHVHSVTLAVPEEIPLDVFWPMVQEDIVGAVQEFYARGLPPQVQEVLQTGTPRDGVIPVAQRLTLEEAEMLAARLAHLSQTAVAVDIGAVQELRNLQRQGEAEDSRSWPQQFAPRPGRQAQPTAPAVASRVRLRGDGAEWISGVVVGHGPPDAPWRCGVRQSSIEANLDVIDDQGVLWEQLPPTQVKLPAVQRTSGGVTSTPVTGVERLQFLEARRLPREVPPVPFLQSLELPQPPPPPLQRNSGGPATRGGAANAGHPSAGSRGGSHGPPQAQQEPKWQQEQKSQPPQPEAAGP